MIDTPARPAALDRLMAVVVGTHVVVAGVHGAAHAGADVVLTAAQLVFVVVVITAAPIYGLYRHLRRPGPHGAMILVASMTAALVFRLGLPLRRRHPGQPR